jgi:hypothetical protein
MTPPSSSTSTTNIEDEDEDEADSVDIIGELMNIDNSLLLDMIDTVKKPAAVPQQASESADQVNNDQISLPLLDQSDDPYLNEGQDEALSFVTEDLDETVQKWMETCEGSLLHL